MNVSGVGMLHEGPNNIRRTEVGSIWPKFGGKTFNTLLSL